MDFWDTPYIVDREGNENSSNVTPPLTAKLYFQLSSATKSTFLDIFQINQSSQYYLLLLMAISSACHWCCCVDIPHYQPSHTLHIRWTQQIICEADVSRGISYLGSNNWRTYKPIIIQARIWTHTTRKSCRLQLGVYSSCSPDERCIGVDCLSPRLHVTHCPVTRDQEILGTGHQPDLTHKDESGQLGGTSPAPLTTHQHSNEPCKIIQRLRFNHKGRVFHVSLVFIKK